MKHHLERARDHMTSLLMNVDVPHDTKVGDWVYLKTRPHRQGSMPLGCTPNWKLDIMSHIWW